MYEYVNNTESDIDQLKQWVEQFLPYSKKKLGFDQPVTIVFHGDEENASNIFGKTAQYSPDTFEITLFITDRHPKDILRSLSHELVHHKQNCQGHLQGNETQQGYAQSDPHMRKMEREAYTKGNLIFRDFEDLIKGGEYNLSSTGVPPMTIKEWKNNELNKNLMKKWGLLKEEHPRDALTPWREPEFPDHEPEDPFEDDEYEDEPAPVAPRDAAVGGGAAGERERERLQRAIDTTVADRTWGSTERGQGSISIREAKEITRRILKRIKKERK